MAPPPSPQVRNALHNENSRSPRVPISPGDQIKQIKSNESYDCGGTASSSSAQLQQSTRAGWKGLVVEASAPPRSTTSAWRPARRNQSGLKKERLRLRSHMVEACWRAQNCIGENTILSFHHNSLTRRMSRCCQLRNQNGFWRINTLRRHRLRQKVEGIGSVKPQRAHNQRVPPLQEGPNNKDTL